MKTLFILLLCTPALSFSQEKETFSGIVIDSTASHAELFSRANQWFANAFKSAQDVIQYSNKEEGKIIGKGNFELGISFMLNYIPGPATFTITVSVKDEKYKYEIKNVFWQARGEYSAWSYDYDNPDPKWQKSMAKKEQEIRGKIESEITAIIENLKSSMSKPADNKW